ncbi:MAG: peptidoglycan editing factor PgeF [Syntrophomonadaceae bacterium]|nr:peptidoglycan editing factor PgeF [Syntrophomonadaceae bacterium]MDD3023077.1 peptidoglycan editing factor PgeF [Syntrophomonadaceae bacterium]
MPKWIWDKFNNIEYITIPAWVKQGINIAFTSHLGGLSSYPYQSLNLGLHVGDQKEKVIKNRQQILQLFSSDLNHMVSCEQVHSANVALVDQSLAGRGARDLASALPDCDALICSTPGLVLATFYADCFPIFFFDPVKRTVAVAHSGWKGTMGRIAGFALEKMQLAGGSYPENVEVLIGPGIESCCFNIQAELAVRVQQEFPSFTDIIYSEHDRYFWDLKNTIRQTLLQSGCLPANISTCDLCTSCHPELFFSYRRESGTTGRMGAFIGLKY